MSPFYIVLATVAIRLVNIDFGKATQQAYIVSIYNKHTGTPKGYQICAGSLVTNCYVLSTRFCLPRHAYKIRYGDMKTVDYPTFSQILHRRYHPNSRPDLIPSKRMNLKQVVSGSNNIAIALIQTIPEQQFGRLAAIDYRTLIGHEVRFCSFDVLPRNSTLRYFNQTQNNEEINLKNIFKMKKKILRGYFIEMNQKRQPMIRHKLAQTGTDNTHVLPNAVRFAPGVVAPCQEKATMGPNMCVVARCIDVNTEVNERAILTPDFGTPLIYDGKIIGLAADVDEHLLKFTPISPFLNWIESYIKENTTKKIRYRLLNRNRPKKRIPHSLQPIKRNKVQKNT